MTLRVPGYSFIAALIGTASIAQAAPKIRAMTLQEALAYAHAYQPSLLAARNRIVAAQAAAQIPRAQWLPSVTGVAEGLGGTTNNSTASYVSVQGLDLVRIGATPIATAPSGVPSASTLLGVGLEQEVYDFGRIAAESAAADAIIQSQQEKASMAELDVALAVTKAFYAVEAAKEIQRAADEAYDRARVDRDAAAAGVTSGLRRPIDLTRAEADLARYDAGRIQAQGALTSAQAVFAAVVGVTDAQLDAGGAIQPPAPLPELSQALRDAQDNDPDVLAAEAELRAQQSQTRAVGAQLLPDLGLSASVSSRAGGAEPNSGQPETFGAGFLPIVPNYDAGLVFTWPLLDFTIKRQEETSHEQESVFQEQLADARLKVNADVQKSYLQAQVADQAMAALQRSVDAAKANREQAQALFKAGLNTAVDLADAENIEIDAEIQLAAGRFEQARARAALKRALGKGF